MSRSQTVRLPRARWVDMSTIEFARIPPDTVAVLPVAAIEQHGPHLPVFVDTCINTAVVDRAIELLPADLPVTVLPTQMIGKSNEHLAFPGTLSLSAETVIRLWTEIGESVARAGIRKLVLLNSHGGQPELALIVARDLRVRHSMLAVCINTYDLGVPPGAFSATELRHGIHAGSYETSIMLAARPDLVDMDRADDFVPISVAMERDYRFLGPESVARFGWQTQDLHASGACGNARDADGRRGRECIELHAQNLVALLREVHGFPIAQLKSVEAVDLRTAERDEPALLSKLNQQRY
jgi:creatinine amidohydrolase